MFSRTLALNGPLRLGAGIRQGDTDWKRYKRRLFRIQPGMKRPKREGFWGSQELKRHVGILKSYKHIGISFLCLPQTWQTLNFKPDSLTLKYHALNRPKKFFFSWPLKSAQRSLPAALLSISDETMRYTRCWTHARRNKCFSICHPGTPNNLVYGQATVFLKTLYNSVL